MRGTGQTCRLRDIGRTTTCDERRLEGDGRKGGILEKRGKGGCRGRIVEKGEELMRVRDSGKWRSVDYLKREG